MLALGWVKSCLDGCVHSLFLVFVARIAVGHHLGPLVNGKKMLRAARHLACGIWHLVVGTWHVALGILDRVELDAYVKRPQTISLTSISCGA